MAEQNTRNVSNTNTLNTDNAIPNVKSAMQQLADAKHEIEDLRIQLAWLERAYE